MAHTAIASNPATAVPSVNQPAATAAHQTRTARFDPTYLPPDGMLSLVIPVHNEEGNLPEMQRQLVAVLDIIDRPAEIIYVDDGSTDATWRVIEDLAADDSRVVALQHRRNFGKAEALSHGFAAARGSIVISMDGDLQDDPREIPAFLAEIANGWDLVSGWKQGRQDPLNKTAPSRLFNWTVRTVSGVPLHDFNCGFKAYRKEVTEGIRLYGELHRFTPVLASAEGFRVTEIPVEHRARVWGESKYGYRRLIKGFLDLLTVFFLTNYRHRPMHLFGIPGLLALFVGVVIGLVLTFQRLVNNDQIGTRPLLLLAVMLVILGTQFFALGLLGEFLAHDSHLSRGDTAQHVRQSINRNQPDTSRTGE